MPHATEPYSPRSGSGDSPPLLPGQKSNTKGTVEVDTIWGIYFRRPIYQSDITRKRRNTLDGSGVPSIGALKKYNLLIGRGRKRGAAATRPYSHEAETPLSGALTAESPSQLDVLGLDRHALSMYSGDVGIFEKTHKISLGGLLEGADSGRLESEVGLEILGNFTHQTLEWKLADEELGGLLVAPYLTESHGSRLVAMGLLYAPTRRGRFAGGLSGELLAWGLTTSRFSCGLLRPCHFYYSETKVREAQRGQTLETNNVRDV